MNKQICGDSQGLGTASYVHTNIVDTPNCYKYFCHFFLCCFLL